MTPVLVFTRDTHPTKPKECLDDDGVGVQEALADPNFRDLLNGRCFLALYTNFHLIVRTNISIPRLKFFSVMLSPIRFLTRPNRQHVQFASRANQGLWDISNQEHDRLVLSTLRFSVPLWASLGLSGPQQASQPPSQPPSQPANSASPWSYRDFSGLCKGHMMITESPQNFTIARKRSCLR